MSIQSAVLSFSRRILLTEPTRYTINWAYFVLQCSAICHALQSMRRGLYIKDRTGSSLMGTPQRGSEHQVDDSLRIIEASWDADPPERARHIGTIQFTWSCRMSAWIDVS